VGELPGNLSTKNPSLDVKVSGIQPHDAHHSELASTSGHSEWSVVAPGSRVVEVVEVGHYHVGLGHPRLTDPSGMSRIESLEVLVRTICHIELYINRYLHKSSRI
jgi:hypothetical protein